MKHASNDRRRSPAGQASAPATSPFLAARVAPLGVAIALVLASAAVAEEIAPPPDTPARPTYNMAPLDPLKAPEPAPMPDASGATTPGAAAPAVPTPPASVAPASVPPPAGATPAGPDAPGSRSDASGTDGAETAAVAPEPTETAPEPLEGPLRPKDSLAAVPGAANAHDETWKRSFDGGVRWKKGDTAVTVSGTPATGFRIGGTFTH